MVGHGGTSTPCSVVGGVVSADGVGGGLVAGVRGYFVGVPLFGIEQRLAARRPAARACRRGSAPIAPDWNTRISFSRIISSIARNVTTMPARDCTSANRSSKPHASVSDSLRHQLLDAILDRDLLAGQVDLRPLLGALDDGAEGR